MDKDAIERGEQPMFALQFARIENHYFYNQGFFKTDDYLFE